MGHAALQIDSKSELAQLSRCCCEQFLRTATPDAGGKYFLLKIKVLHSKLKNLKSICGYTFYSTVQVFILTEKTSVSDSRYSRNTTFDDNMTKI